MQNVRPPAQQVNGVNRSLVGQAVPLIHVDGGIVADEAKLARLLMSISGTLREVGSTALSNPFASSILFHDIAVTSGTKLLFNHLLGHAIGGWLALRPRSASWVGYESMPQPVGVDPTRQVEIVPGATGTFDFLFY